MEIWNKEINVHELQETEDKSFIKAVGISSDEYTELIARLRVVDNGEAGTSIHPLFKKYGGRKKFLKSCEETTDFISAMKVYFKGHDAVKMLEVITYCQAVHFCHASPPAMLGADFALNMLLSEGPTE